MAELSPRARAKRDQIRTAARELFLAQGFAATSMDGVAAKAGVSKQTLYSYFPGKADLLTGVLQELIQDVAHDLSASAPAPQDAVQLRKALCHLARQIIGNIMQPDYIALVRVIVAETPHFPEVGTLFRTAVPDRILMRVAQLMEQMRAQGIVRLESADAAARLFVGPLLTYILLDGLFVAGTPPVPPGPEQLEELVDLYLKAIIV